ncbi:uncharacterized protein LOC141651679 [Silene latifolia]|uniref:uncharacterized protein LOC141651679 n=1 Tax=Silene latifolia TaxID=37657 RepID=UPI003D787845
MWGMDIVGKLPRAPGNRVYMLVMTDNFSKWIEAEAMTEVKEAQDDTKGGNGTYAIQPGIRAEAVIPSEDLVPIHRYGCQTAEQNQIEMTRSLDTVDELRESAYIRMASYKQSVARTYNKNVNVRTLAVGGLVLQRVFENTKNHKADKFAYKWEGPYQVESIVKNGAYRLMTMQGQILHRPWNIRHLKQYFV